MSQVLVATDADWIHDEVDAALSGSADVVSRVRAGRDVRPAVTELHPDLVILDLQIGNMGGIATCLDLRLESRAGRIPSTKILILLDRAHDVWLAYEAQADGWLVKPLDAFRLRRAADIVLAGGEYREGVESAEPASPSG